MYTICDVNLSVIGVINNGIFNYIKFTNYNKELNKLKRLCFKHKDMVKLVTCFDY